MAMSGIDYWSVKRSYTNRGKRTKKLIHLLENNQDMTFSQIAEASGVKVEKVFELNSALERERALKERIRFEQEKAERVLTRMEEGRKRRDEQRLQIVESLYFYEGRKPSEIGKILGLSNSQIYHDIQTIKEKGGM